MDTVISFSRAEKAIFDGWLGNRLGQLDVPVRSIGLATPPREATLNFTITRLRTPAEGCTAVGSARLTLRFPQVVELKLIVAGNGEPTRWVASFRAKFTDPKFHGVQTGPDDIRSMLGRILEERLAALGC